MVGKVVAHKLRQTSLWVHFHSSVAVASAIAMRAAFNCSSACLDSASSFAARASGAFFLRLANASARAITAGEVGRIAPALLLGLLSESAIL